MRQILGADWMVDVLDAHDYEGLHDLVSISEIVPGDTIEADDRPRCRVENISMIREQTASRTVRRYLIETDEGTAFKLPAKRKVRRL